MVTSLFGQNQSYRRLSRSRTTLLGSLSLWEGADHFVQVEVTGFSETRRRFYFEDIKALTVRRTRRGLWLHLLFGAFTMTTAAIALWVFASGYSSGGLQDWLAVGGPSCFALGWLAHLALGPTCDCHVMTPVQNARLGALTRIRRARKVLGYLARRAQTSQGGVVGQGGGVPGENAFLVEPDFRQSDQKQNPAYSLQEAPTSLYSVASSFSLLNAACLFGLLVWDSYPLRAVQVLLVVGLLTLGISCVATSRRRTGDRAAWFKWIGWALFTSNGLIFLLWYGYGIYLAGAARARAPGIELNYVQDMFRVSPHDSRFWFWVVLVSACFSMTVGLIGLAVIFLGRIEGRPKTDGTTEKASDG